MYPMPKGLSYFLNNLAYIDMTTVDFHVTNLFTKSNLIVLAVVYS